MEMQNASTKETRDNLSTTYGINVKTALLDESG